MKTYNIFPVTGGFALVQCPNGRYLRKDGKFYTTIGRECKKLGTDGVFYNKYDAERKLKEVCSYSTPKTLPKENYMIIVEHTGNPKKVHNTIEGARTEALRLSKQKQNIGKTVRIITIVETIVEKPKVVEYEYQFYCRDTTKASTFKLTTTFYTNKSSAEQDRKINMWEVIKRMEESKRVVK